MFSTKRRTAKSGFTLVELLVVIAIIGILIALLIPAVQAVRAAARRTQCMNNLRQIAIACHSYDSNYKKLPTAGGTVEEFWIGQQTAPYGYENAGWMYQILPFIEQNPTFNNRLEFGWFNGDQPLASTRIGMYQCPSRDDRFANVGFTTYALGDYAGVMGSWNSVAGWGFQWQVGFDPNPTERQHVWTGIISRGGHVNLNSGQVFKFSRVKIETIRDGASNTIMFMEKAVNERAYNFTVGSWDYWELTGYYTGADWPTMRMFAAPNPAVGEPTVGLLGDGQERPDWVFRNAEGRTAEYGFGSAHGSIVNAVMGDCSTHGFDRGTDVQVLELLGHRADGNYVSLEDF